MVIGQSSWLLELGDVLGIVEDTRFDANGGDIRGKVMSVNVRDTNRRRWSLIDRLRGIGR